MSGYRTSNWEKIRANAPLDRKTKKEVWKTFHRYLIECPTKAEKNLCRILRHRKINFIFQKRIGRYFYDFLIKGSKLLIEVDGGSHNSANKQTRDMEKESIARKKGYRIIRFSNWQVWNQIDKVIYGIKACKNKERIPVPRSGILQPVDKYEKVWNGREWKYEKTNWNGIP